MNTLFQTIGQTRPSSRPARRLPAQLAALVLLGLAALGGAAQAQSQFSITDSHVTVVGRTNAVDDSYAPTNDAGGNQTTELYWAGTEIRTSFIGSTTVAAAFRSNGPNYSPITFSAYVDGVPAAVNNPNNPDGTIYNDTAGGGSVVLATGLDPGATHTLLIRRNGSSSEYVGTVESIILDNGGTLVTDPANAPKNRRIEFFGDSVTAGANIEPLSDSPDINNDGDYYDDNYNAYSAQTARNLNADAHFTAQGGIGLLNGFLPPDGNDPNSDTTIPTLGHYWDRLHFEEFTTDPSSIAPWNFSQWQPQVVVIAIGHNDISKGVSESDFIARYRQLIQDLQSTYPGVTIFCTSTPISNDSNYAAYFTDVFNAIRSDNTPGVYVADAPYPYDGHGGHPRLADHTAFANSLTSWIGGVMGW